MGATTAKYRIVLAIAGVPTAGGQEAAADIQQEFATHRQHHEDVTCTFSNNTLTLTAINDYDPHGLALMDDFSDCVVAYVMEHVDAPISIVSVRPV